MLLFGCQYQCDIDCLERLVSEMTCYVLSGINSTHTHIHTLIILTCNLRRFNTNTWLTCQQLASSIGLRWSSQNRLAIQLLVQANVTLMINFDKTVPDCKPLPDEEPVNFCNETLRIILTIRVDKQIRQFLILYLIYFECVVTFVRFVKLKSTSPHGQMTWSINSYRNCGWLKKAAIMPREAVNSCYVNKGWRHLNYRITTLCATHQHAKMFVMQ